MIWRRLGSCGGGRQEGQGRRGAREAWAVGEPGCELAPAAGDPSKNRTRDSTSKWKGKLPHLAAVGDEDLLRGAA